ncbi:MAG TPA: hypothetical protein VKA39_07935, partial [Beijerinckiaceae bacterium]|nr:hypothetical protein [Beijerinckiaceae bacterium]
MALGIDRPRQAETVDVLLHVHAPEEVEGDAIELVGVLGARKLKVDPLVLDGLDGIARPARLGDAAGPLAIVLLAL